MERRALLHTCHSVPVPMCHGVVAHKIVPGVSSAENSVRTEHSPKISSATGLWVEWDSNRYRISSAPSRPWCWKSSDVIVRASDNLPDTERYIAPESWWYKINYTYTPITFCSITENLSPGEANNPNKCTGDAPRAVPSFTCHHAKTIYYSKWKKETSADNHGLMILAPASSMIVLVQ